MEKIKNIVFDLGGVLLNLDFEKTFTAFKNLGVKNIEEMYSQNKANPLFEDLETGHITPHAFHQAIMDVTAKAITPQQIDEAWNAMLLDFRLESLAFLKSIKNKYRTFLFSNTNIIHMEAFQNKLQVETGNPFLDSYFTKTYYSHEIGLRKPHPEAFDYILRDGGLKMEETLFIDDSTPNIEAANKIGLPNIWLQKGMKIEDLGL